MVNIFLFCFVTGLLSTPLSIGFPVVFAERAVTTARGTIHGGNGFLGQSSISSNLVNGSEEYCHLSETFPSPSLCIRPLNTLSRLYLRTLKYHHICGEKNDHDDEDKNSRQNMDDCCWESTRNAETKLPVTPAISVAAAPSIFMLRPNNDRKNGKAGPRSLALKVDLLFATMKVNKKEITLPKTIFELFQLQKVALNANISENDVEKVFGNNTDPFSRTSVSSTLSQLQSFCEKSSRADPRVDLTGRWRPSKTISTQDLNDYDNFLKACCSDQLSYWTRTLISSSSIVSRQELVVKQLDGGRVLEIVDIHPLTSRHYNRTIVTSKNTENSKMLHDDYQAYENRLKDPRGNPILIEAYWQENGTVHTSLVRQVDGGDTSDDRNSDEWLQTKRYLFSEKDHFKDNEVDQEGKTRMMVVETTYHSAALPAETQMIWKWEQVSEPS